MYATSSTSNLYHLVTPTQDRTVCGLPVVPIVIDRAAYTSTLHLTDANYVETVRRLSGRRFWINQGEKWLTSQRRSSALIVGIG